MGREQWGEGFSGITIMDAWTKSRGRGEVGGERWVWMGWRDGEKMLITVIE